MAARDELPWECNAVDGAVPDRRTITPQASHELGGATPVGYEPFEQRPHGLVPIGIIEEQPGCSLAETPWFDMLDPQENPEPEGLAQSCPVFEMNDEIALHTESILAPMFPEDLEGADGVAVHIDDIDQRTWTCDGQREPASLTIECADGEGAPVEPTARFGGQCPYGADPIAPDPAQAAAITADFDAILSGQRPPEDAFAPGVTITDEELLDISDSITSGRNLGLTAESVALCSDTTAVVSMTALGGMPLMAGFEATPDGWRLDATSKQLLVFVGQTFKPFPGPADE